MEFNSTGNITDCSNFISPESPLRNIYFQSGVYLMYIVIFVVAFLGNSFICYVVVSSPRMHTVTNFFIMNLAIGDMLIIVLCVPFTSVALMQQYWPFGSLLCPVVNYCQALSVFISAYTLVAISIDKYRVIMWPLKPRITKGFAVSMIFLVWLIAGTTVLPSAIFASILQPEYPQYVDCNKYICREDFSAVGMEYEVMYSKILMVLQYVVPSTVLLFTYISIAIVIWCHRIPGEAENSRDMRIAKSKRKMIKMMVTVVTVYSICWLPYNILMVKLEDISDRVMMFIYFPLHGLAMSHACYNPIIYCSMNSRFREALFALLRNFPFMRKCGRKPTGPRRPGIGYETALEFAKRGARVILACQNEGRATAARESIVRKTQNENVVVRIVNLASLSSVRNFAKNILDTEERLDILVNNAGAGFLENSMTDDGLQLLMQVNYFGPTLLTILLIDLLRKSAPSRIVNVSSRVAQSAKLTPDNLNSYPGVLMNYYNSKLGNIIFTMKLAKLLKKSNVSVFSLHPGSIDTELLRNMPRLVKLVCDPLIRVYFKTPEEGAQTTLHASLEQGIEHYTGRHFKECTVVPTYKTAMDEKLNKIIWDKTMKLINCDKELLKLS